MIEPRQQIVLLKIASTLAALLFTLHLADDIVRGFEPGTPVNLNGIYIVLVWLYGTLVLGERRSGQAIALLGCLLSVVVPYLHFGNQGGIAGGRVAGSHGVLLWVFTLLALGCAGAFGGVLAVQALWRGARARGAS